MSMYDTRCVFPTSTEPNPIFSPLQEHPWYEDRYGSKKLPWKKWKIYKEQPKSVKKNQVETITKTEIDAAMRGKMLIKSDLPRHLEVEVAKTIKANIPAVRRGSSLKAIRKSVLWSETIAEDDEDEDSDVFGDDDDNDFDLEELEEALDNFLDKLESLDPDDLDEITTGVRTALKSWLTFGASITGTKSKSVASVARESVSEACPNQSRMRVMFRNSTTQNDQLRFDEDMGPETVKTSAKSKRAAKAIADLRKGDDKQTRKAAETVTRISSDFCVWLRDLPEGGDPTVNNISPDKIKSLFDAASSSKTATSTVAKGLQAWAKFGQEVAGARQTSIFTISKSEVDKVKAFEKFKNYRSLKTKKVKKKKIKVVPVKKESDDTVKAEPKMRLDHRNYGAWYIAPTKYQKRFEELSDPKSIEIVKSRIMEKKEKQNKIDIKTVREKTLKPVDVGKNLELASVKAFKTFLSKKRGFQPPEFLKKALNI